TRVPARPEAWVWVQLCPAPHSFQVLAQVVVMIRHARDPQRVGDGAGEGVDGRRRRHDRFFPVRVGVSGPLTASKTQAQPGSAGAEKCDEGDEEDKGASPTEES